MAVLQPIKRFFGSAQPVDFMKVAKVVKKLCQDYGLSGAGSKKDNILALKARLGAPSEFVKVFSKMWGGSGGWLGMSCPHSICYGLKWIVRQEGARDHVDMLLSLKYLPNFSVVDFANMVASHGEKRKPGLFTPYKGRVAEPTEENVALAKDDSLHVSCAWYPSGSANSSDPAAHPVTKAAEYYCLFDAWHESNSSNPHDLLRSTRCVQQLEGLVSTEVAEQLNNKMNRNNYFLTSMSPHNSLFVMRLLVHFHNRERNCLLLNKVKKELDGYPYLNELGQLRISQQSTRNDSSLSINKSFRMASLLKAYKASQEVCDDNLDADAATSDNSSEIEVTSTPTKSTNSKISAPDPNKREARNGAMDFRVPVETSMPSAQSVCATTMTCFTSSISTNSMALTKPNEHVVKPTAVTVSVSRVLPQSRFTVHVSTGLVSSSVINEGNSTQVKISRSSSYHNTEKHNSAFVPFRHSTNSTCSFVSGLHSGTSSSTSLSTSVTSCYNAPIVSVIQSQAQAATQNVSIVHVHQKVSTSKRKYTPYQSPTVNSQSQIKGCKVKSQIISSFTGLASKMQGRQTFTLNKRKVNIQSCTLSSVEQSRGDRSNLLTIAVRPQTNVYHIPLHTRSISPYTISNLPNIEPVQFHGGVVTGWFFPSTFSQSRLDGRNGSNACSVICLLLAKDFFESRLLAAPDRQKSLLSTLRVTLLCKIRQGNSILDASKFVDQLPTSKEALNLTQTATELNIGPSLLAKFNDIHTPSTLGYHLNSFVLRPGKQASLFICNERTSLFMKEDQSIVYTDTHLHIVDKELFGSVVLSSAINDTDKLVDVVRIISSQRESDTGSFEVISYMK